MSENVLPYSTYTKEHLAKDTFHCVRPYNQLENVRYLFSYWPWKWNVFILLTNHHPNQYNLAYLITFVDILATVE